MKTLDAVTTDTANSYWGLAYPSRRREKTLGHEQRKNSPNELLECRQHWWRCFARLASSKVGSREVFARTSWAASHGSLAVLSSNVLEIALRGRKKKYVQPRDRTRERDSSNCNCVLTQFTLPCSSWLLSFGVLLSLLIFSSFPSHARSLAFFIWSLRLALALCLPFFK